jgi:two-component system, LytTR family, response regulator
MTLKCIIVDDEEGARFAIRVLLQNFTNLVEVVGEAEGIPEALTLLKKFKPKLVFLDLEMVNSSGFEIFRSPDKHDFEVIVTSSYQNMALDAFKYGVADYLVKPLTSTMLERAIRRVMHILAPYNTAQMVTLQTSNGTRILSSQKIFRLESDRNYTWLFGDFGDKILSSKNLGHFETLLENCGFIRIHHSHLVSAYQIVRLDKTGFVVELKNGEILPISRDRKKQLLEKLRLFYKVE